MEQASIIVEGNKEACIFKWIESERAGRDLGDSAIHSWVRQHWNGYLRARWIEHLQGRRLWMELDSKSYGLLQREFKDQELLLDRILDRIKFGKENLDIIVWAHEWGINVNTVLHILERFDINSMRLSFRFAGG